jgi:hypothetical protein
MKPILTIDCFYIAWRNEICRELQGLARQQRDILAAPERIAAFTFVGPTSALADAGHTIVLRPAGGVEN